MRWRLFDFTKYRFPLISIEVTETMVHGGLLPTFLMTIPEEPQATAHTHAAGRWYRRVLQVPSAAAWVPEAIAALTGLPSLPVLRGLQTEPDGQWSVEELFVQGNLPLAEFLTKSAAPVWVFVSIVQQCLSGLVSLHRLGLRHGLLGPQTILVNASGHVVLTGCCGGEAGSDSSELQFSDTPPPLPHSLVLEDLGSLGRTFRSVLGGNADEKLTVSRSDIAPLVAEWIDWLADPETGCEPESAAQADVIFNEIRTGRPGLRPWKYHRELPPEIAPGIQESTKGPRRGRFRNGLEAHSFDPDWRPYVVFGLVLLALMSGGAWLVAHFLYQKSGEQKSPAESAQLPANLKAGEETGLADEAPGLYDLTGGDCEPVADTKAIIAKLMNLVALQQPPKADGQEQQRKHDAEEQELRQRADESMLIAKGGKPPLRDEITYLHAPEIFPPMGTPSAAREAGDYYLVWRTRNFVLTDDEARAAQSAILRTARFCGVRIMAWVVLPNHAGVVLRVPPRAIIPDEKIERRIAILRGEKTAASVIAQINARLRAGDSDGADQVRRTWTASMGTAAGFFSVVRTAPILPAEVLAGRALWQDKPLHMSLLDPDKPDLLRTAAILDSAAVTAKLTVNAHEWPLSSLTAAMLNYGPALRSISVLMQRNPTAFQPVPPKEDQLNALRNYRRHLGDLPQDNVISPGLPDAGAPLQPTVPRPPLELLPQTKIP